VLVRRDCAGDVFADDDDDDDETNSAHKEYVFGLNDVYQIAPTLLHTVKQQHAHTPGTVDQAVATSNDHPSSSSSSFQFANHSCDPNTFTITTNLCRNLGFSKDEAKYLSLPLSSNLNKNNNNNNNNDNKDLDNKGVDDDDDDDDNDDDDRSRDVVVFIASKDIRCGQEILFNYYCEQPYRECNCNSNDCIGKF